MDCGSGGRLGFNSTNNVLTPKHLEIRWATINYTRFKNPDEDVNTLDIILSQIETGFCITSIKEIMIVLQNEPNDCFIEEIRKVIL